MRIGVLTGGGDCPGLNAVIRAAVLKGVQVYGHEFLGFRDGWRGPVEGLTMPLGVEDVEQILTRGGTILGSSRTNPYKVDGGVDRIRENVQAAGVDALIAIGGEDTLGVARRLTDDGLGVVGVPKTIDNDLSATELTFGFDTAVQICVDAIDRLHTTAESHHRVMVVEVMGRHAGWIALHAGMAGGATVVLIPEQPFDMEAVCEAIRDRHTNGQRLASIVVVSEGATPKEGTMALQSGEVDSFGHVRLGGMGTLVAQEIEARTGYESRVTTLGRGGSDTSAVAIAAGLKADRCDIYTDVDGVYRVLATRFGVAAIDAVHAQDWGTMVALQGGSIVRVSLAEAVGTLKLVDPELYEVAQVFFG